MPRVLPPSLVERKNALATTGPWLLLFEIDLAEDGSEKEFFTHYHDDVEFDGKVYRTFPISIGEIREDGEGRLTAVQLIVSNIRRLLASHLESTRGLINHTVTVRLVQLDYLDDPTAFDSYAAKIQQCSEDGESVAFEIGHGPLLEIIVPPQRYTPRCRFVFKGRRCGYAGAATTCDKTLTGANGCVAKKVDSSIHPARFGGFPVIPRV